MNVVREAYGLPNAWLISLDYSGSTCTFTLLPQGTEKLLQSGPFDEGYSRSFCGNCQHSSNHNAALARGGLRVEGGGKCNESSNGRRVSVCMHLNPALWTHGHTQHKQLHHWEIHVSWNALNANQFTETYFKALLLWYTLTCKSMKATRKTIDRNLARICFMLYYGLIITVIIINNNILIKKKNNIIMTTIIK